jgi:hypothetical protein
MASEEQNNGFGAGGGAGMDDSGNNLQSASATYQIAGNQIVLLSRKALPPVLPDKAGPSVITILAAGALPTAADDGKVDIRGAKGVRVTAGPPGILPGVGGPPTRSSSTDGVEIEVAQDQRITLDRGDPLKPTSQSIALIPGSILIESGTGNVVISSLTKITLAVGANSITIDAKEGITIVGLPYVQINPTGPPPVDPGPLPPLPPGQEYA